MTKRGPKTKAGKEVVRLNAVQHGVLSNTPVIPGLEREDDWEAHRAGLLASLAPNGHLETALAERVALQLWRLQRVTRYEREAIAVNQEQVDDDVAERHRFDEQPQSIEEAREAVRSAEELVRLFEEFPKFPDDGQLSDEDALEIVCSVAERVDMDPEEVMEATNEEDEDSSNGWTGALVRKRLSAIAEYATAEEAPLFASALEGSQLAMNKRRRELQQVTDELERMRRERLLPDESTLNKIVRYEAHLNRQLYQALHELEALQTRRLGGRSPLARLDVHGLPEGSPEK